MMRRPESGHRNLCRSGCWAACLLTGLIGGCTEAPQQEFAIRETTRDLIPEARAAVESSLLTYFGTPTAAVAWERLPLKFGGAVGQVESVDGPNVVVQWDEGHAPTPAQSAPGSPVVWPGSGVRSGKVGAGDTVAAYDPEKRLLTLSAADPAPAVGDRVALNFGHTLQVGRVVYAKNCGHCHGASGDGEGPTAKYLNPRPRDYRNGVMKFTSTATPARASREDLKRMIREGIPGTYMPSFLLMKDEETDAVIEYILYLSMRGELEKRLGDILKSDYALSEVQKTYDEKLTDYEAEKKAGENPDPPKTLEQLTKKATDDFADFLSEDFKTELEDGADFIKDAWTAANETDAAVLPHSARVADDAASRERGRMLFLSDSTKCYTCHGPQGRGDGPATLDYWPKPGADEKYAQPGLHDIWGNPQQPRDLTRGVYRGGRRPLDLYRRIHAGIKGTQMAGFSTALKDDQIWDVVNYVMSLPYESSAPTSAAPAQQTAATAPRTSN